MEVSEPLKPKGWYDRRYLPHFDAPRYAQAITFRLADSLPAPVVEAVAAELRHVPEPQRDAETIRRVNLLLDAGHGGCVLRDPRAAALVQEALLFGHGERYDLLAWTVMPNHVHALVRPCEGWALGTIIGSWKKRSAREINKLLGREGTLWFREYFDRFQRDAGHLQRTVAYIERNPAKAGLCGDAREWRWSSARFRDAEGRIDWSLVEATVGMPGGRSGERRSSTSETG